MALDQIDIDKDELPAKYRNQLPKKLDSDMTFMDHVEVLRSHIVRSVISVLVLSLVVGFTISFFYDQILLAPTKPNFITYKAFCRLSELLNQPAICLKVIQMPLHNRDVSGQFMLHLSSSFMFGLILSFPYILYQIWKFVRPALKSNEASATVGVVFFCSTLFFMGVAFAFYIVIPLSYQFMATYQVSELIVNEFDLQSYMAMFTDILLACGIMFQLPMLVFLLTKIGILTPNFMIEYRRHAVVVILIAAAILTPPDVFSMILLSIPLLLLYEGSIFISRLEYKRYLKKSI
jgi:sec-independent protein translocase protein TatC